MALLKLRRHTYFLDCDAVEVKQISESGRYEVVARWGDYERRFQVIGGLKSGGSAREWFVYAPDVLGEYYHPTTSMIAAIRAAIHV